MDIPSLLVMSIEVMIDITNHEGMLTKAFAILHCFLHIIIMTSQAFDKSVHSFVHHGACRPKLQNSRGADPNQLHIQCHRLPAERGE